MASIKRVNLNNKIFYPFEVLYFDVELDELSLGIDIEGPTKTHTVFCAIKRRQTTMNKTGIIPDASLFKDRFAGGFCGLTRNTETCEMAVVDVLITKFSDQELNPQGGSGLGNSNWAPPHLVEGSWRAPWEQEETRYRFLRKSKIKPRPLILRRKDSIK